MSVFTDYNKFIADYDADCRASGISPRQATILAMTMAVLLQEEDGRKVYFIQLLPDRSTLKANDTELLDLMTAEKPYLEWGDSEKRSFAITGEGVAFIKANSQIFNELISGLETEEGA